MRCSWWVTPSCRKPLFQPRRGSLVLAYGDVAKVSSSGQRRPRGRFRGPGVEMSADVKSGATGCRWGASWACKETGRPVSRGGRGRRSSATSTLCQLGMQSRHCLLSSNLPAAVGQLAGQADSPSFGRKRPPGAFYGFLGSWAPFGRWGGCTGVICGRWPATSLLGPCCPHGQPAPYAAAISGGLRRFRATQPSSSSSSSSATTTAATRSSSQPRLAGRFFSRVAAQPA